MATIEYKTKELLEKFLKVIYNKNIDLSPYVNSMGNSVGQKDKPVDKCTIDIIKVNSITGIDIPVLVSEKGPNKGNLVIVAQDPLRSKNDKMLKDCDFEHPIIGTPFALHYNEDVCPQTRVYRKILKALLAEGYSVYLTDAHKIYSQDKKNKTDKKKEIELLGLELKEVEPICVITLGSTAKEYVKATQYSGNTLNLLHPAQTNWDHWRLWIFEQAFSGINNYNVDWKIYADLIGCRSNMFEKYSENDLADIIADITLDIVKRKLGIDVLFKEAMSCNALTPEEDFALTKAVQDKGTSCDEMNKLHEVYDSFVVSVAKQYLDKGLSLDELVEAGKSGLEKAALKYDHSRGFKFIAYAVWWIRQPMLVAIESKK